MYFLSQIVQPVNLAALALKRVWVKCQFIAMAMPIGFDSMPLHLVWGNYSNKACFWDTS